MKTHLFLLTGIFSLALTTLVAQVHIDKPIELTGGTGERSVTGLELPVDNSDAANKEYVDNAVSAGGGGTHLYTIGDASLPTMLSTASPTGLNTLAAITYCRNLTESGYSDWRFATVEEVYYILANDLLYASVPNPTENVYVTALAAGRGSGSSVGRVYYNLGSNDHGPTNLYDSSYRARCVR